MAHNFPYLRDKDFLKQVDLMKVKEQYVKITVLDFYEKPIKEIQGKVTSGNLNIDGSSSMRRTCNLNMFADEETAANINAPNNLLSLNKKVEVMIGFTNTIKGFPKYEEFNIIWFPLGIFVIVGCSINHAIDGVNLSFQLKDKMCLLNGEVGGTFPASVVFDEYDVDTSYHVSEETNHLLKGDYDGNGTTQVNETKTKVEKDGNISLFTEGLFKMGYDKEIFQPTIYQIIQEVVNHFGGEQLGKIIINDVPLRTKMILKWVGSQPLYGVWKISETENRTILYTLEKKKYDAWLKQGYQPIPNSNPKEEGEDKSGIFTFGDNVGYTYTDFTYPKELSANAGDNVCSVLDQIVQTLGNFEYFYDVDGNFIFQEKKNYLNTSQSTFELKNMESPDYLLDMSKGKSTYTFDDGTLVNSYSAAPQYGMVKNDFLVWGIRETIDGKTLPCRYHLVIDDKPQIGNHYNVVLYEDETDSLVKAKVPVFVESEAYLPKPGLIGVLYAVADYSHICYWSQATKEYVYIDDVITFDIETTDWRSELYLQGTMTGPLATDGNYYYSELAGEWPKLYDLVSGKWKTGSNPTDLDFFLDFIDDNAAISQFSVSNIGRRQKVVNDSEINCLFEPTIEEIIFIKNNPADDAEKAEMEQLLDECQANGMNYTQVEGAIYDSLAAGKDYNSAYAYARDLLYQYTSYNEAITLQVVPIYYLDVNSRITVRDTESGIFGDYNINSISVPLDVSSLMSISASKVIERA